MGMDTAACSPRAAKRAGRARARPWIASSPSARLAGGRGVAGEQRCNTAYRDAAVLHLGGLRRNLQILLAVALRGEILRRDLEALGEGERGRLGAAVRQRQIVDVGADCVGVAF